MDQKKLLVIVAVIVLLLLGGGAYMMSQSGQSDSDINANTDTTNQNDNTNGELDTDGEPVATDSAPKTIFDLVGMTGAQKCTFTVDQNGSTMQSVAYVSGGKARTDIVSVSNGTEQKIHMIMDGQIAYTWIDGMGTGFKMDVSKMKEQSTAPAGAASGPMPDFNQNVNYDCQAWTVDNSLLIPPTTIQFMSLDQLQQ